MEKISNAIKCVHCKLILKYPVILPCGHSACKKHVDELDSPIICIKCSLEHPIATANNSNSNTNLLHQQQFPPNKDLEEIIAAQIGELDFGKEHNTAKMSCEKLDELIRQLDVLLNDPNHFTHNEIDDLKNAVEIKGEELKALIDDCVSTLVAKMAAYKCECKAYLGSKEFASVAGAVEEVKREAKVELNEWMVRLDRLRIDEAAWKRITEESEEKRSSLVIYERDLKEELLLNRFGHLKIEVENFLRVNIEGALQFK